MGGDAARFRSANKRFALIIGANGSDKTSIANSLKNLQLVKVGGSTARHQACIGEHVRFRSAGADGKAARA